MKREVWVETTRDNGFYVNSRGAPWVRFVEHQTIHESRWIPVSERIPTEAGHYQVIRYGRKDWAIWKLHEDQFAFTHTAVTHWLEAPPLPVEDEFEKWWKNVGIILYPNHSITDVAMAAWNAAKESK